MFVRHFAAADESAVVRAIEYELKFLKLEHDLARTPDEGGVVVVVMDRAVAERIGVLMDGRAITKVA